MAALANGDPMLARVTGTGCMATALIGAFLGAGLPPFDATAAGLATIGIAAEAAIRGANGPGSFQVALIDALYRIDDAALARRRALGCARCDTTLADAGHRPGACAAIAGSSRRCCAAVDGGVTIVQLRDKAAGDDEMVDDGTGAAGAPRAARRAAHRQRPADVAVAAGADGVHIGQSDGDPAAARALLGRDALLGLSVTGPAELATVDPAVVDYVGLGPVFARRPRPTPRRRSASPASAPSPRAERCRSSRSAASTRATPARSWRPAPTGIAVVSAICAAADPGAAAAALRRAHGRHEGGMIANILSIAGSIRAAGPASSADLKTFAALGAYGMAVIDRGDRPEHPQASRGVRAMEPAFVADQIDAVFADIRVDAVKIGMVGTAEIAEAIADALERHRAPHIVLDPVMVAKGGDRLLAGRRRRGRARATGAARRA